MRYYLAFISLLFILFSPLSAQNKFLSLDEAFVLKVEVVDDKAVVKFDLADKIYVYKNQVSVQIKKNDSIKMGSFTLPKGEEHDGDEVYLSGQTLLVPLEKTSDESGVKKFELLVNYQGCSGLGLCYEPSTSTFLLEVNLDKLKKDGSSTQSKTVTQKIEQNLATSETSDDLIKNLLAGGNIFYIIGGFFIFGLLLSLTPCVFPMVPILSSVIVSHGSGITTKKAFMLSMVYVQAMAITYTVAGVIAGLTGAGVQAAFQTPWVIAIFSGVFVLLALSMFGLFEIQMPQAMQSYLNKKTEGKAGGGYTSIAIMGLLSALIVGPCVAAPLAAALGFISQTGDALLGGIALYALSMGMGMPLLIIGTGAGKFMPRPGSWMDAVKSIFGVMMLAVAIWMLSRIIDNSVSMFLWSALIMFTAVSIGAFETKSESLCNPCYAAKRSIGLIVFFLSVSLFIGSITGASSMFNPLEKLLSSNLGNVAAEVSLKENSFKKIHSISELEEIISRSKGKKIMLDFYAEWCTSCKELEHITFTDAGVKEAWKDYVLIQADVTQNTDDEKALSKKFGLFGPPALIFYDENGQEVKSKRTIGFIEASELREKLGE